MRAAMPDLLSAELSRLDLLMRREALRLRARYELSADELRGLYVSDERVDALIESEARDGGVRVGDLDRAAEALRREIDALAPQSSRWWQVGERLGLTDFERDVLLLAVAPEI